MACLQWFRSSGRRGCVNGGGGVGGTQREGQE